MTADLNSTFLRGRPPAPNALENAVKTHLLCLLTLSVAALGAAPALAQDNASLTVQSSVPSYCANLNSAAPISLGELTDGAGFLVQSFAATPSFSTPGFYCNAPATVTLTAAPLMRTPAIAYLADSFTDRIDYRASLDWDDVDGAAESAANLPAAIVSTEANTGALTITLSDPAVAGQVRPIAGAYEGAVTVTVSLN